MNELNFTAMNRIQDFARVLIFGLLFCGGVGLLQAQELRKGVRFVDHRCRPAYHFKKWSNTSFFQGNTKRKKYFEGWYFKMVARDGSSIMSVIPGISLSADGKEQHAFIQLIDGITAQTYYYRFPIEEFSFSEKEFAIRIGANYFSKDSLALAIDDQGQRVCGKIRMLNLVEYKSGSLINPGIMGWYRFVPRMECYHGVVSLSHDLKGKLWINDKIFDFDSGKGYIEKDWGASMPSSWIWMQSNHFTNKDNSLMLSIATIPWLGKSFTGFLGFFYHNQQIVHFATYRSSKLYLETDSVNKLKIRIKNKRETLILQVVSNNTGMLKAPVSGMMDRRIPESIDATIRITMLDKNGQVVLTDSTNIAGLEMVGDFASMPKELK